MQTLVYPKTMNFPASYIVYPDAAFAESRDIDGYSCKLDARLEEARTYRRSIPFLGKLHPFTKAVCDLAIALEGCHAKASKRRIGTIGLELYPRKIPPHSDAPQKNPR